MKNVGINLILRIDEKMQSSIYCKTRNVCIEENFANSMSTPSAHF